MKIAILAEALDAQTAGGQSAGKHAPDTAASLRAVPTGV